MRYKSHYHFFLISYAWKRRAGAEPPQENLLLVPTELRSVAASVVFP